MLPGPRNLHTLPATRPCLVSGGPQKINIKHRRAFVYTDDGMRGWAMKRARGAELAAVLYRCESVIHWVTYYTAQEEGRRAAAAQHVRVIPARLLNFGSLKGNSLWLPLWCCCWHFYAFCIKWRDICADQTFMQTPPRQVKLRQSVN